MAGDEEYHDQETSHERRDREVREARPAWWAYAGVLLAVASTSVASLLISIHYADATARARDTRDAADRRAWCAVVVTLDEAYHKSAPTTPTGRTLAVDMAALRIRLGC